MNNTYDYDYCCKELEVVARDIRDKILNLPVIFHDVRMLELLSWLLPEDEQECWFCHTPIKETLEKMSIQWYDRHPQAQVSIDFKKKRNEEA